MKITFNGAALNVTGSKHLIETNGLKILFDCGLHQGKRAETTAKNRSFPFNPKEIDAVILSHAHADHCGMLPLLVKQGFSGKIYATPATRDIAEYIMLDSSHIQKQDAEYFNTHLPEGDQPIEPIYDDEDVKAALAQFEPVEYFLHSGKWTSISKTVKFKFLDAGHILGSSIVVLTSQEGKTDSHKKTIAFSGDLGGRAKPLLRDPEIIEEPLDAFLLECTYGNHTHRPLRFAKQALADLINRAVKHKQKILVPAFALGRTQEIIYILHQLTDSRQIPRIPIYIDSPLASHITKVFEGYNEEYDAESWRDFSRKGEPPFSFTNLNYTQSPEESKELNTLEGPWMVVSSSGMCEAGRILHHLKNHITDPDTIIAFTGYQAEHTLGRKILTGQSPVKIYGQYMDVKAQVEVFNEFSAHADQSGLLDYLKMIQTQKVCLVHTEEPQAQEFKAVLAEKMPEINVIIPEDRESLDL